MLRVILVDDEALARQGLRNLLTKQSGVQVVGEAECAEDALRMIERERPDGIFLDIRMPETDGFELLSSLKASPPVIFVTAYTEYAVRAFEVQAVDYLLKPVRPKRLTQAIRRLQAVVDAGGSEQITYGMTDRICLRTPEKTLIVPLCDIIVLQAEKDFTWVTAAETPPLMICQSLGAYERNLPNPPFLRIDRSTIINLTHLHSLEISPTRGAHIFMEGASSSIPIGRAALRRLRLAIPQYLSNLPDITQLFLKNTKK